MPTTTPPPPTLSASSAAAPACPIGTHAPVRFLRLKEVLRRVGLSRSSLYRQIAAGTFPQSIRLSEHSVGWLSTEIDRWIERRIDLRGVRKNDA